MVQNFPASYTLKLIALGALCLPAVVESQTPMVQTPIASTVLGIPASTYNGTATGATCSSSTPGYLTASGDGCPGTQAVLEYPYGVAIDANNNLAVASVGGGTGATYAGVAVLYQGGAAMAAALVAAKPSYSFTPLVGHVYYLGNDTGNLGSNHYCNNTNSSGGVGLDIYGDGCPAQDALFSARAVAFDASGNIFIGATSPVTFVRVIYVGGTAAANLIKAYNPTVTTPQVGYIYALSGQTTSTATLDFVSGDIRGLAIQQVSATVENVFATDNGTQISVTGQDAATAGNQVKEFACPTGCGATATSAGWITYILGSATTSTVAGDGGSVASASVDIPYVIISDKYGNLFIADDQNERIRVVYHGGTTPPLYINGSNATVITNPVVGDIYTVAGGTTSAVPSPALASSIPVNTGVRFGLDPSGNLYFLDTTNLLWIENASTGKAVLMGYSGALPATGSASSAPGAGVPCNGSMGGPTMTDGYGDGCPATEILPLAAGGPFVFDTMGNFYQIEDRTTTAAVAIVRKYTYGNQFGLSNVGSSTAAVPLAFTPSSNTDSTSSTTTYSPTISWSLTGVTPQTDFADAGNGLDLCSTEVGRFDTQTCVYYGVFTPTLAGSRSGSLTLSSGTTIYDNVLLGGVGTGAQASIDPATQSTIGTGLTPQGVAVDQGGNFYFASGTSNGVVYKSTSGGTPVILATGFSNPGQVAVNGAGTVYVADSGNNRIASVSTAGGTGTSILGATFILSTTAGISASTSTSTTLGSPSGVAVDQSGNVFISDTGNNRIIEVVEASESGSSSNVLLGFSGLSSPKGIAVDNSGDVFVADSGNSRVVELSATGVQSTITVSPTLSQPIGVAVDAADNLYIADVGSEDVSLVPYGSTTATALIGDEVGLTGIAADNVGDILVAASSAGGLLKLNRSQITYTYPVTNVGSTFNLTPVILTDTGNAMLNLGASLDLATEKIDFSIAAATTNGCSANQTLGLGGQCALTAIFQPQSAGTFTDTVTFPSSNAVDSPRLILNGPGAKEIATTTILSYATIAPVTPLGGYPIAGDAFSLSVTITPSTYGVVSTGTVIFTVDGTAQKAVSVAGNGTAFTATISLTLAAGAHTTAAVFSGDATYAGSSAASLPVTVVTPEAATLGLTYVLGSPGTAPNTINTTLTATIAASNPIEAISGIVNFSIDGGAVFPEPVTYNSSTGTATATYVPALIAGTHTVIATYLGTSYYYTIAKTITFPVVTGTSSLQLTVAPTGTITFGQVVTVTAVTTTGNASATPTGTINFTVNGVVQAPVTYAASVPFSFSPLAGSNTIFVSYSGDGNYAPAQNSVTFTVVKTPSAIALQPTLNIVGTTNTITFTAKVGPAYTPTATGTVAFSYGTTSLGTAKLVSGLATFTTTTSIFASYSFTASYSGDTNYLPSTITVTPSPTFVSTSITTSLSVPQTGVGVVNLTLSSFYGYTGTITFSCTGLPANSVCQGVPTSQLLAANAIQPAMVEITTNTTPLAIGALRAKPNLGGAVAGAEYATLVAFLGLSLLRRRRLAQLALSVFLLATALNLAGCSSDTRSTTSYPTPPGTYAIGIVATDGTITSTSSVSLTVVAGSN